MKTKAEIVLGADVITGGRKGTLTGYLEWGEKLRYVWVKFKDETEAILKPKKVKYV